MNKPNSWYVTTHFDRLNDELLSETYGKREVTAKTKSKIEIKPTIENDLHKTR